MKKGNKKEPVPSETIYFEISVYIQSKEPGSIYDAAFVLTLPEPENLEVPFMPFVYMLVMSYT